MSAISFADFKRIVRWRRLPIVSGVIVGAFVIAAILGPYFVPHSPYAPALSHRLIPPSWIAGGDLVYPLGTDQLGRDMLSRLIVGARTSLLISVLCIALGGGVGGFLGIVSGYFGGMADTVIMRITDGMMSLPIILLALILVVTLGPSFGVLVVAISLVLWARFARVVRGEALSIRERDFVMQARINGCSDIRIMLTHIAPNVLNTWLVMATLQIGWVIILEASLSFLGAGIPPPTPAWGSMAADGRDLIGKAWWVSLFPGIAIFCVVMALNLLGDWIRDTLDPRLRDI